MAPAVQRMAELTWGAAETAWTAPVNGISPKIQDRSQNPEMAVLIQSTDEEVSTKEATMDTNGMLVRATKLM